jgi:hypothetical protein
MNNTLKEIENKLAAAKALVEKLEKEREAANQKYELQGGGYSLIVTSNAITSSYSPHPIWATAGLERKTEALAQSALKQIRAFSRMLAYVHEHCPEWEADWNNTLRPKYAVFYNNTSKKFEITYWKISQYYCPLMDRPTAIKLADDLNSGRFSLE